MNLPPILRFAPTYFERIWGGTLMRDVLRMPVPQDKVIGEAWLVSDHPHCESMVDGGPLAGLTLRELVLKHSGELLGSAAPTPTGRFPLLLKLIDAGDLLSVQVHPDDAAAVRLGEPDVGKTEMWYVMEAQAGAQLIYGMKPDVNRDSFLASVGAGTTEACLKHFNAEAGTNIFVPAGTVHAIGAGLLIAEIQQNSDITYRIFDYNRVDTAGNPRQLHIDKAIQVMDFSPSAEQPQLAPTGKGLAELAACEYFRTEHVQLDGGTETYARRGESFEIIFAVKGTAQLEVAGETTTLSPGEAALIPACIESDRRVRGETLLLYSVPSN